MAEDCCLPIKDLVDEQNATYDKTHSEARGLIDKLYVIDSSIKSTAITYYKSARDAEDGLTRYQEIKYAADMSFQGRSLVYDNMMKHLIKLKDSETKYKETVD